MNDITVDRWQATDELNERLTAVNGIDIGDFIDEVFGRDHVLTLGELLERCYAATLGPIALGPLTLREKP